MRILITGGGGYLGNWVTAAAIEAGHTVRVFDRFCFLPKFNYENRQQGKNLGTNKKIYIVFVMLAGIPMFTMLKPLATIILHILLQFFPIETFCPMKGMR